MGFHALEKLHQLYDGYRRTFVVNGESLLLLQDDNRVYLIANRCPHMNSPLSRASIQAGVIRCPVHGFEFDLASGCARQAGGGNLRKYDLAYEGNQVGIYL